MLGISILAVILTYVTFGIFHAFNKMSKHISSYSGKIWKMRQISP